MTRIYLTLALMLLVCGNALATIHTVGSGRDFATITLGVQAATTDGDSVFVYAGAYSERIAEGDWAANNVFLHRVDGEAVTWNNPTAFTYIITAPNGFVAVDPYTGTIVDGFEMSGTDGSGPNMEWANDFTFQDCHFNDFEREVVSDGLVSTPATHSDNVNFIDCQFTQIQNINLAYIWVAAFADNWTWTRCDFDFSGATVTAQDQCFQIAGAYKWVFEDCTIKSPLLSGAFLVDVMSFASVTSPATMNSSDIQVNRCTFTVQDPVGSGSSIVTLTFGQSSAFVDSVIVQESNFHGPFIENVFGIKVEAGVAGTFGRSDYAQIRYNEVHGFEIGIGLLESSQGGHVYGNLVTSLSTIAGSSGIMLEQARYNVISNNTVRNVSSGFRLGSDGVPPSYENFGNQIISNLVEDCTNAISGDNATSDSTTVFKGNVYRNNGTLANLDAGASVITTIAGWNAHVIPGSFTGLAESYWNGQGDLLDPSSATLAAMRKAGVIPPIRHMGGRAGYGN